MAEPLSLADLKAHLRLDPDDASEDGNLQGLVVAARVACEYQTGRAIVGVTEILVLDAFPGGDGDGLPDIPLEVVSPRALDVVLAGGTVAAVSSIGYVDPEGAAQTLGPAGFTASLLEQPARLSPVGEWPAVGDRAGAVTIAYLVSPLGPADFAVVVQAMKLICGHWYRNREAVAVDQRGTPSEVPLAVSWLLQPLRQWATE